MKVEQSQAEATLITRILAGESLAFEELFHSERARLHRVAYQIVHDHWDAEELVQDTFVRAYRHLSTFRRRCSLRTWLHAIVINSARNRYWYFRRRFRHATELLSNAMLTSDFDPASDTTNLESADNLSTWLEELPPSHRDVLSARVLHHHTYEEIATKFAINVGTVKSRLSRARRRLRQRWVRSSDVRQSIA